MCVCERERECVCVCVISPMGVPPRGGTGQRSSYSSVAAKLPYHVACAKVLVFRSDLGQSIRVSKSRGVTLQVACNASVCSPFSNRESFFCT